MKNQPQAEMKTVVEKITPDMARKYLECNYENRTIRQAWIEQLVHIILRGQWVKTHQGIAFDESGRLVDGQHRLMAIAQAGKTVECLVSRDLPTSSYRYIDAGKSRNLSDRIKLTEGARENEIAVSIMRCYCLAVAGKSTSARSTDLIENQFLGMADEVCAVALRFRKRVYRVTTAPIGAAIARYMLHYPKEGQEFLDGLVTGTGLGKMSPILTLREALVNGRTGAEVETYWKAIQATKYHQRDAHMANLTASSEDWDGHLYERMAQRRAANAEAGAETKKIAQIRRVGS